MKSLSKQLQFGIKTAIPQAAREVVRERHPGGLNKVTEYLIRGKVVGRRFWDSNGALAMEYEVKNRKMHGVFREWHPNGVLSHESHYINGMEHGLARQYDDQARLIGTYRMNQGTGFDRWYQRSERGKIYLSEEREIRDGKWHGFERWWGTRGWVWQEGHFWENRKYGIFREWNHSAKLRKGFPKYYINDQQVSKRLYLRACLTDQSLPRFTKADNRPYREKLNLRSTSAPRSRAKKTPRVEAY
jgi:antitoxin component YwqK of YwqJK toxin-antitoxin module